MFWITLAGSGPEWEDFVEAAQIVGAEFHVERADIFLEVLAALSAGDGDYVVALRQHPGERELRWLTFSFLRDLLNLRYQIQFVLEFSPWKRGEKRR